MALSEIHPRHDDAGRRRGAVVRALPLVTVAALLSTLVLGTMPPRPAPGQITGAVLGCDGAPLAGVDVQLDGTGLGALTNGQGRFLMTNVPPGTYTLRISRLGYAPLIMTVTVSSDASTDLGRLATECDRVHLVRFGAASGTEGSVATILVADAEVDIGPCMRDHVSVDGPFNAALFPFPENLVPAATCGSELAAFSVGTGPYFHATPTWTTAHGDEHADTLGPPIPVPLHFWIAAPAGDVGSATDLSLEHWVKAQDVYDGNRVGVSFGRIVTTATAGMGTISDNCPAAISNGLQSSAWYVAGAINVYYVSKAQVMEQNMLQPADGVSCTADTNIVFISYSTSDETTLAHEIGHAFGLRGDRGHTNWTLSMPMSDPYCTTDQDPSRVDCQPPCLPDWGPDAQTIPGCQKFAPTNIMDASQVGRSAFTVGQVYQMVLLQTSRLNLNGSRTGPTKLSCGAKPWEETDCPRLWLNP